MAGNLRQTVSRLYHRACTALPLKNYIIFESNPDLGDSAKPVFDEMVRRGLNKTYKMIWWVADQDDPNLPKIENVVYMDCKQPPHAKKLHYCSARAKYFIYCNKHMDKLNKRTKSFYITHGTAVKSTKAYYPAPEGIDYCFIDSPHFTGVMAQELVMPESKLVALGYPRNDALLLPPLDLHPILKRDFEKVIVWYPTYRQHKGGLVTLQTQPLPILHDGEKAKKINAFLAEKKVLIVIKPHFVQDVSYVKDLHLSNLMFIDDRFFAQNGISSYQFVGSCDALLTDYSSIYFDYLLCDKPVGVVWEDIDAYRKNPGFAIDLDYYMKGAEKIYQVDDLLRFIENVCSGTDGLQEARKEISALANFSQDGENTKRVTDFIISKMEL